MEEDFYYIELFEIYKGLLTERQREAFSSHYLFDLSLSEIAESAGTSRQSVLDSVKKVKEKLITFEKELRIKEIIDGVYNVALSVEDKVLSSKLKEIIGR